MISTNQEKILRLTSSHQRYFKEFFSYLKNYFFWLTKRKKKLLVISHSGIQPVHFYCKIIKYDYILAKNETQITKLFNNFSELKKSNKNIGSITRSPSMILLPHNIYNKGFYIAQKCGVTILCAIKIENTCGPVFMSPDLFFICIKTYKLENKQYNVHRQRLDILANFLFLMLFLLLVKINVGHLSKKLHNRFKKITNKKFKKKTILGTALALLPTSVKRSTAPIISKMPMTEAETKSILKFKSLPRFNKKKTNFLNNRLALNSRRRPAHQISTSNDFMILNATRKGPLRTTKKKYNFKRYFKFARPRNRIPEELDERKAIRYKKLVEIRFNLNEWILSVLKIKLKKQFYKKFILVKSPYFALSARVAGLYKMEIQFNFLLLRSFMAPNINTANSLIINKYVLLNDTTNSKPLTKLKLMSIVRLPSLIKFTLFLFKPYRYAYFHINRRLLRYLRYKYYFRRYLFTKYHYFKYFNRRTGFAAKFIKVKQCKRNKILRYKSRSSGNKFKNKNQKKIILTKN